MALKRRTILGATAAAALAGCVGSDDSSDETPTSGSDDDGGGGDRGSDGDDDEYGPSYDGTESGSSDGDDDSDSSAGDDEGTVPTVRVSCRCDLGPVLVNAEGMALYLFEPDPQGEGESTCYDGCAENWPPLAVEGEPTAGEDVTAELTTFEREDGQRQVAANGWPLYSFVRDEYPGDVTGQGVNDVWWAVRPDGTRAEPNETAADHEHDATAADEPVERAEVAMVSDEGHHFDPHLAWIEPGGSVTWTLESGGHTTTAYHSGADKPDRIPAGADGWDSGFLQDEGATFERTFDAEGVYDYFCRPHEGMGMVGTVVVGEPDPREQPALEPPQEELPAEARAQLERLNDAANETLGHTHD